MSRHVVMSCHVVTLETDLCVCPCQYSPTHVKDQNPCLCVTCQFQHSHHPPQLHVGLVKVWLENARNQTKPSATPPFQPVNFLARKRPKTNRDLTRPLTPARILFLIPIKFGLTTPNRGMVPPVHAATQAGGLNYC